MTSLTVCYYMLISKYYCTSLYRFRPIHTCTVADTHAPRDLELAKIIIVDYKIIYTVYLRV